VTACDATAVTASVAGHFVSAASADLITCRANVLSVLTYDAAAKALRCVAEVPLHARVLSLAVLPRGGAGDVDAVVVCFSELQVATVYLQTVPQQLASPQLASRSPPSASPKHRGSPLHSAMNPRTACAAGSASSIRTCDGPQPLLVPALSLLLVPQAQLRAPGLAQAVPQVDRMCSRLCCCSRSMCALCSLTQLSATLPAAACDAPKSCRPSSYARSTTLAESAPV
jgi:hypothetical protein